MFNSVMILTIKNLKEAISDIPEDNIVYVKTMDGYIFDIRCIDDATSVGFWELKLSDTCTAYSKVCSNKSKTCSKDLETTLYCSNCGSIDVEMRMWVNPNTQKTGERCSDFSEKDDNWCKTCESHAELLTLEQLWDKFGEISVNDGDEIEEDFLNFSSGTSKFDVWHWFDERCPNNLHDDLIYG